MQVAVDQQPGGACTVVGDPARVLMAPVSLVYKLWVEGHPAKRTAQLVLSAELQQDASRSEDPPGQRRVAESSTGFGGTGAHTSSSRGPVGSVAGSGAAAAVPQRDGGDYQTLSAFEEMVQQPRLRMHRIVDACPCDSDAHRRELVRLYYEFDAQVFREFMGYKLTARLRATLDDIAERTRVPLRSCRRQFDNLRRVFTHFDDHVVFRGNTCEVIRSEFLLPPSLCRRYACALFLLYHRFDLETSIP